MNIMYMTFGEGIQNHLQASFSIYSFLSQKENIDSITVLTSAPSFYEHLKNDINIVWINDEQLKDWKGPHNFFWRVKIKALELICSQHPGETVMYLDTDTFLYHDIKIIKNKLAEGHALMHENEGALSKDKSKTTRQMWGQVSNESYSGVTINESSSMWNAGVVATPNTLANQEFKTAVEICDAMCEAGVTKRLIEQFALSISLQHFYGLEPADDCIAHYWSNKDEWNKVITDFISGAYFKKLSLQQILSELKDFDFKTVPVVKKQKNTQQRLQKFVSAMFPPKEIRFIK